MAKVSPTVSFARLDTFAMPAKLIEVRFAHRKSIAKEVFHHLNVVLSARGVVTKKERKTQQNVLYAQLALFVLNVLQRQFQVHAASISLILVFLTFKLCTYAHLVFTVPTKE